MRRVAGSGSSGGDVTTWSRFRGPIAPWLFRTGPTTASSGTRRCRRRTCLRRPPPTRHPKWPGSHACTLPLRDWPAARQGCSGTRPHARDVLVHVHRLLLAAHPDRLPAGGFRHWRRRLRRCRVAARAAVRRVGDVAVVAGLGPRRPGGTPAVEDRRRAVARRWQDRHRGRYRSRSRL